MVAHKHCHCPLNSSPFSALRPRSTTNQQRQGRKGSRHGRNDRHGRNGRNEPRHGVQSASSGGEKNGSLLGSCSAFHSIHFDSQTLERANRSEAEERTSSGAAGCRNGRNGRNVRNGRDDRNGGNGKDVIRAARLLFIPSYAFVSCIHSSRRLSE